MILRHRILFRRVPHSDAGIAASECEEAAVLEVLRLAVDLPRSRDLIDAIGRLRLFKGHEAARFERTRGGVA